MASLANLVAASLQIAGITLAATAAAPLLRNAPEARYLFWRLVLVLCLALPWLQTPAPSATPAVSSHAVVSVGLAANVDASPIPAPQVDWTFWMTVLIAAAIVLRATWMAVGYARLRQLRHAGAPAPPGDYEHLQATLRTAADVRYVSSVKQPVTFGVFRPVVLLPEALRERPATMRHAVIAHELVHVHRRDWAWLLVEEIVRTAICFHPAIWWLVSRVQLAREEVVDRTVVALTGRRREYVEALLAFADEVPLAPAPAFARRRHLFRRIVLLSTEEAMSARRILVSAVVLLVVVGAASWSSVAAFPLRTIAGSMYASPQWTIALLERGPGPVERSAKPTGADNPIPKRIHHEDPVYPSNVEGDFTSVIVTLRTIVNEAGQVAELRLGGFSFRRGGISGAIDGGPNAGQQFAQLANNAQFRDAGGPVVTAASMRSSFEAFIESAADAVQRWQYEPPRDGPIAFNTVVRFTSGQPLTARTVEVATRNDVVLRVGGAIKAPTKLRDARPVYPQEAQDAGIQGVVIAEVTIGADGSVVDARVRAVDPCARRGGARRGAPVAIHANAAEWRARSRGHDRDYSVLVELG